MNFLILACVLGGVIEPGTDPEVQSVLVVPSEDLVVIESITVDPVVDLVFDCCDCDCDCDCDCLSVVDEVPEPLSTDVGYLVGTGWANPRATGSPLGSSVGGGRNYPVSGGGGGFGGFGGGGGGSSSSSNPPVVPEPGTFVLFGLGLICVVFRMYPVGCIRARA